MYQTFGAALQEALADNTSDFAALLHSAFVKPFVLTGVLRNFINSGINDVPTEASMSFLDSKSDKFRKLHQQA